MIIFKHLKIFQKLLLFATGITIILSSGFYFYFVTTVKTQLQEGLQKKGMGLIQASALNLGASLYSNDEKAMHSIFNSLENDPDVAFIYVVDKQKKMKYGYKYSTFIQQIKSFLRSNQLQTYASNLLILKQSIFLQDEYQGDIVVGFNLEWVRTKVAEQRRYLAYVSIAFVIFSVLLLALISRTITKPLKDAVDSINQYSRGGGEVKLQLPVRGTDEVSQLARSLNQLAENLDTNIQELNDSRKYLETLFQLNPIPIIIADTMGKIEGANESASNFFGIESGILVQMNMDRFFQQDDLNAIYNRITQELRDIKGFVTTMKMSDGIKRVVELNVASHRDELNYVKNVIIAIIDITEKIQIQREILHNQGKLQRINEELTQKTEEAQRLSDWNKRNAHNLSQLITISQKIMRASRPKEIMQKIIDDAQMLFEAEESFIYLWDSDNGSLIPAMASTTKVLDRLATSITESANFIWETYRENDAFVHDSEELKQEEFKLLGIEPDREFSLVSVPISERDYRFGVIVLLKFTQHAFRVEDVHLISTLANQAAILLDNLHLLNALKEKAASLEKAYSELQKSQQQVVQLQKMESLGTLVGGIAHDFNNILGIIIPNTDLLRTDSNGDRKIIRRANIIAEAAQRAADLTRQLLMFSRNQDIQLKVLSPNQLISRLTNMLKRTLGKEYEILIDLDPEIEDLEADETRLTQVLINLAVNSRDAMPDGGQIVLRTRMKKYQPQTDGNGKAKKFVCISISDTGIGIKKEDLDKIFDPFFTTKSVGKGTGLGLSVVYGIVQSHKGYVEVQSEEGKGTTFSLYFPPSKQKIVKPDELKIKSVPRGSENILVVDDENMIRESAKEILSSFGYSVTTASNGLEALEILKKNKKKFDLAIVDMSMPKINGVETIRRIREIDQSIKVVLSSGHMDRERNMPVDLKLDGTLPKPYRLRELALKIRQILNHKTTKPA
ncbi:MAG TPA: response regulator [Caldithrix sp.]|nr:response regulator [Caldithrix sp.]